MIPTAEEFLKENNVVGMTDLLTPMMIAFATFHVEAALEAKDSYLNKYGMAEEGYDTAYPLTNIK
tara:strand:+ start:392 stop:586 length:195 start_codon:yes stop_codon:yes gene_type:complete